MEPAVDVVETAEAIIVTVQVPGVSKDDLALEVTDKEFRLTGTMRAGPEGPETRYHCREICYGTVARTVPVPVAVESDKARATLKDGILQISVPKSSQAQAKALKIEVS